MVLLLLFGSLLVISGSGLVFSALQARRVERLRRMVFALTDDIYDVLDDDRVLRGLARSDSRDDVLRVIGLARQALAEAADAAERVPLLRGDEYKAVAGTVDSARVEWTRLYDEAFVLGLVPVRLDGDEVA